MNCIFGGLSRTAHYSHRKHSKKEICRLKKNNGGIHLKTHSTGFAEFFICSGVFGAEFSKYANAYTLKWIIFLYSGFFVVALYRLLLPHTEKHSLRKAVSPKGATTSAQVDHHCMKCSTKTLNRCGTSQRAFFLPLWPSRLDWESAAVAEQVYEISVSVQAFMTQVQRAVVGNLSPSVKTRQWKRFNVLLKCCIAVLYY